MEVVSFGQVLNAFGDPIVCVGFHWLRVKARENPFRFELIFERWKIPQPWIGCGSLPQKNENSYAFEFNILSFLFQG